jgi:hypothetical protein
MYNMECCNTATVAMVQRKKNCLAEIRRPLREQQRRDRTFESEGVIGAEDDESMAVMIQCR